MSSDTSPIVVLDSGLGGLTVARAIRRHMPSEDVLYFGDTARVPYGSKSPTTVTSFVREILLYLEPYCPKHVVFACNTATALALPALRAEFPHLRMSGVIEPGARAAVEAAGDRRRPLIGIIGTDATIRSKAYERAVLRRRQHAALWCKATPLLAPIIEEGRTSDDPVARLAVQQYLRPLVEKRINVLVLGCTHYPVLRELICQTVGPDVAVIDSADKCADDVRRRLRQAKLERVGREGLGYFKCFVTDDTPRFSALASRFMGFGIEDPTWVPLDDLRLAAERGAAWAVRSAG